MLFSHYVLLRLTTTTTSSYSTKTNLPCHLYKLVSEYCTYGTIVFLSIFIMWTRRRKNFPMSKTDILIVRIIALYSMICQLHILYMFSLMIMEIYQGRIFVAGGLLLYVGLINCFLPLFMFLFLILWLVYVLIYLRLLLLLLLNLGNFLHFLPKESISSGVNQNANFSSEDKSFRDK